MTNRRAFLQSGAAMAVLGRQAARADVPAHLWQGWFTIGATTPTEEPIRNFGLGLVGYTWEESGPSLAARKGEETLEQHVEKLAALPFVDVLYIRCDWRHVQSRPGRLDLVPIWPLTLDAAKRYGLRVAFRVQLSNPQPQPRRLAMPDFLQDKIPLVKIGRLPGRYDFDLIEPRYDHPEFQKAFQELNELLAAEFDSNPLMEYMDLMQYGFWGEGHTSSLPSPFPDYLTAEKTFVNMTRLQIEAWKRTALAVNTQPDISKVGNREVIDMAVRAGCWLRSDSVLVDEPEQIEELANRPPWLAVIMEDGSKRRYSTDPKDLDLDAAGVSVLEKTMLHVLDLGANYWSLWTEAGNLRRFREQYPNGFNALQRRIGYRIRPSWIWQRKRYGTAELIVAFANDGVAGVPGVLRAFVESRDGKIKVGGSLDAGHPYGGKLRLASFLLPKGLDGASMTLRGEIETKGGVRCPLRWACAQPLNADGSLAIQLKPDSGRGWRKGI
jgi:hypothetical protein